MRVQEYIELVRAGEVKPAIAYAQKYFPAWADTQMKEIQRAMTLIAFPSFTKCMPYKVRAAPARHMC